METIPKSLAFRIYLYYNTIGILSKGLAYCHIAQNARAK